MPTRNTSGTQIYLKDKKNVYKKQFTRIVFACNGKIILACYFNIKNLFIYER